MEIEAPTFNALNKPQKRALILRDHLRFVEPHHLDSFIEGIINHEPPTYKKISGTIQPPLTFVTLKAEATRFNLGNVLFPEENNTVYRAQLTVEDGRIEMRTEEALPKDDANLESVVIHSFIARTMVPMFKDKFQAIFSRMNRINEARRTAHKMAEQAPAPAPFYEGQSLARLEPKKAEQNGDASRLQQYKKRQPGEPVVRHVSNKRKQTGLDTIPDDVKSATFNTIPEKIKVDLFDNVMKTAFPNFDNLMVASWNVVSIYTACGSDFPELHKAIVDLKDVLQDFDESFGLRVDRSSMKYRHDLAGSSPTASDVNSQQPLPQNGTQNGSGTEHQVVGQGRDESVPQEGYNNAAMDGSRDYPDVAQASMPPPPSLNMDQFHEDQEGHVEEHSDNPNNARVDDRSDRRSSSYQPSIREQQMHDSVSRSAPASPGQPTTQVPRDHLKRHRDQVSGDECDTPLGQATSPELARRRQEYASSIGRANDHSAGVAKAPRGDDLDEQHSERDTPIPKKKKTIADYTAHQLRQRYQERKASLIRKFGGLISIPPQHAAQLQQLEQAVRIKEQEEKEGSAERRPVMGGAYLGHSVLGAKKTGGMAPVAPMLHTRNQSNGGNDGGRHAY